MAKLFVSYSHNADTLISEIIETLSEGGHRVWVDQRMLPGEHWKNRLEAAIRSCDALILAMTPLSIMSEWCQWEYNFALSLGKPVVPVLLEKINTPLPAALPGLAELQYVDLTEGLSHRSIARLMGGLERIGISTNPSKPPETPPATAPIAGETGHPAKKRFGRGRVLTAAVALIAALAGVLAIVVGTLPQPERDTWLHQVGLVAASPTSTPTPTSTNTPTATPTPTPTHTPTPSPTSTPQAEDYFEQGYNYLQENNFGAAITSYTAAIDLDPAMTNAYFNRGIAYFYLGDYDLAIVDFEKVLSLSPDDLETQLKLSESYFEQGYVDYDGGNSDLAATDFVYAISYDLDNTNDNNAAAYYELGMIHFEAGNYQNAIYAFGESIKLEPPDIYVVLTARGKTFLAQEDYERAIRDFDQAIDRNPSYTEAYGWRGDAYLAQSNTVQAMASYNAALSLKPDDLFAIGGLIYAYWNDGLLQNAAEACDRYETVMIEDEEQSVDTAILNACTDIRDEMAQATTPQI